MLHTTVIVITVILAVLLIGIVLIQKSKGGGLSSQFGNASAVMGVRQTNTFLEKGTWWLVSLIVVLSIVSAYTIPSGQGASMRTQQSEAPAAAAAAGQFDTQAVPVSPVQPAATPEQEGE